MAVEPGSSVQISRAFWETPEMRRALASHDLKTVFVALQRGGMSQRRISGSAGITMSDLHDVLYKNRRMNAYELLVRVADGLDIPRGYMGLVYDRSTELALGLATSTCSTDRAERDEVRDHLSHAA